MQTRSAFLVAPLLLSLCGTLPPLAAQASPPAAVSQETLVSMGLARALVGRVHQVAPDLGSTVVGIELDGALFQLRLDPHSVRADSFAVRAQVDGGAWIELPPEPVRTYRGSVLGDPGSLVAASLLDDGLHARVLRANGQEYWIEPLAPRLPGADPQDHVVYRRSDVLEGGGCDADLVSSDASSLRALEPGSAPGPADGSGPVTAELACDADFEYFSDYGAGTQARIESVINAVNLQYSSQVGITHAITTILIRTTSDDPYTSKPADKLLNEFRIEWNTNQSGIQRDLAQLFTGRNLAGSTIGIAYLGTVCNLSFAYSLVESDFASSFACVTDLSAHELGHNWDADHCSCSGFTMNPSITCANTFHPSFTIPEILAFRDAASCFGGPPPTTGSVAGTVTSSADGSPIAGATVQTDSGQSDTTAGDGSYSMGGVPTGSRTVTASASGFVSDAVGATVSDGQTTTVDFALDPAPVGSGAIVDCITYTTTGGPGGDKHLFIEVALVDDNDNPLAGASVSVAVTLDGGGFGTATGTTDGSGIVTFNAKNAPNGCFVTDVTAVSAAGLSFDGTEPANGFAKGSDSTPDADCRSGSDPCGAG